MLIRNILSVQFIFLLGLVCPGQNINETIEYINDKLEKYDHTAFLTKRMNSEYAPDWNITSYDKLSISKNGEVTIERIIVDEGVNSVAYDIKFYLRSLSDSVELTSGLDMYKKSFYDITIKCKTYGCMISTSKDDPSSEKMNSYTFSLADRTYSQRVTKAIGRLIELSNTNTEYFEDDPFK